MAQASLKSLQNIVQSALDPSKAAVMATKLGRRFMDQKGSLSDADYKKWLEANAIDMDAHLQRFDTTMVSEAKQFTEHLSVTADAVLSKIPHDLGGGGGVPFLYLITRLRQPMVVVETGVAAGFSSATFLSALEKNGKGHLYSSDFPYFRLKNPEQYVGVVVDKNLKERWSLLLEGDDSNLPVILARASRIDIFHYDSDKSYKGRSRAMRLVTPRLAPNALIIMDDIQDNCHFHDLLAQHKGKPWQVIRYDGKYIGVIGQI